MSPQGVALVAEAAALAAGYSPELFSGDSLRAEFLTEAERQNANLFKMEEHSHHPSLAFASTPARPFYDLRRFRF
ncbi:hypothetical protein HNO88_002596 [Novosphingobium chloroacetimidivorans]|uniref:Uncharacterized protein n=1 Tax=Novosphingobium chloroacetimidivorans TaxID=1428314 RepID=A0A7W7NXL8_9SPHN|nr:hypothetical protein [Novosphingobium chloroacetimidivorans]MBB4859267.1 hypothetical protein [Novosphingobium chloroacetimidivorans]